MSDCKLLHVQLSFQSTLTHKWGLEQNHFISNSCIFFMRLYSGRIPKGLTFLSTHTCRDLPPCSEFQAVLRWPGFYWACQPLWGALWCHGGLWQPGQRTFSCVYRKYAIICTKGKLWVLFHLIWNWLFKCSPSFWFLRGSAFPNALIFTCNFSPVLQVLNPKSCV